MFGQSGMNMMIESIIQSLGIDTNELNKFVQAVPVIVSQVQDKIIKVEKTMNEINAKLDYLLDLQVSHNIESGSGVEPILKQENLLDVNTYNRPALKQSN